MSTPAVGLVGRRSPRDFGDLILTVPDTDRAQVKEAVSRARETTWESMWLCP